VTGELGTMLAANPLAPQSGGAVITVETADGIQHHEAEPSSTYFHQLVAFRDAINDGTAFPTTADDGVRNMEIIDACYRAAGLVVRPTLH
jgi:predicted dehydrogenase